MSVAVCSASFTAALATAADKEPSAVELAMWEYAVSTGELAEVDRFLELYPDSVFNDAAIQLKATLSAPSDPAASTTEPADSTDNDSPAESAATTEQTPSEPITFDTPLVADPLENKRSLQQLADGSPLFPPIAELPAEVWEGKNCSNCHAWKRDNLCEQAQFLASKDDEAMERIKHPYGGFFKDALKQWAAGGCL